MAYLFQTRTDGFGHARQVVEAAALATHGVPGYKPQHGADGGECAGLLHETPVLLRYVLTLEGTDEVAEVEEVSIAGNAIPAAYFDADTRADWGRDCMRARAAAGWL